ncbi:SRPBCC family protein [Conexibacter woesei]|uniref:Polyketide cyclase/dehydrase n=1 Tax=Conexibacter woesei (strain DSM 14684 / CCUG 47730 / CIP 108061 / JCM 11494 / NBRC 100937 / ID131577) TaxID=469383 RepID=D3FBK2_CONWI|nr:SRPBCC family protein [Conexibacter woesei]ADB49371.1 Polyketide cyclase/dehydrase [Conexibacter woesei DSM 14684]
MARNEIVVHVSPDRVFDVLSDPRAYARWVVGSQAIRRADPDWPAPGSSFDHAVGVGPLRIKDHSSVLERDRPRRLRLLVMARPLSRAFVTLTLHREGSGTRVELEEIAADTRSRLLFNPLTDPLVGLRNRQSLRRLKRIAEGDERIPPGELPPRGSAEEASVTASSKPA